MAMNLDALLRIKADVQGENSIRRLGNSMQGVTGKVKNLQMAVGGLAGGFGALTGALTALAAGGALKGVMDTFGSYQADILTLNRGLKNLGNDAPRSLEPLKQIASDLGEQTLFNEEDFNKGFGLLTSFGNIGVKEYERVARAASDVAQVSGTDVQQAMMQLAKALNAPSQGVSALARSGIQFTDAQKDLIKELEETGRIAEAQQMIFKELEKQYGGASVAAAGGFAGAMDTMGEKIYDVQKALGPLIEDALKPLIATLTTVADVLGNELLPMIDNLPAPVKTFAAALVGLTGAFVALKAAMQGVIALTSTAAWASLVAAGPWIALAAGITAAAVALGSYRTESQKLTQSLGAAARGGGAADLARARNRIVELQQQISLAERQQASQAGGAGGGGRRGGQRSAAGTSLSSLRAELARLRQDVAAGEAGGGLPPALLGGGGDGAAAAGGAAGAKAKKGLTDAQREAKKLADELARSLEQGEQLGVQLKREVLTLAETSEIERERLQIGFSFEDRLKQINELKNEEQRINLTALNDEVRRLELINLQTKALEKQAQEAEALFKKAFDATEFGVSGGGPISVMVDDMQRALDEFVAPANKVKLAATAIGDSFSASFKDIITGAQSAQQAIADFFGKIGDALIDYATQAIAQYIAIGIARLFAGLDPLASANQNLSGAGALSPGKIFPTGVFAEGGFVTGPTNALIGEAGNEYVIPAKKMATAMARYSRGARGESVVSGNGTSLEPSGAAAATMEPIDVRYSVERINNVEYVTADQFQAGMREAAMQGAQRGQQMTLRRLQQSPATRKKVGI